MTVVNFNNISGINSITAESNSLNFYDSAGGTLSIGASVSGNITGDVTGNLTGNVIGNVTGNLVGNVTGNVSGDVNAGVVTASSSIVVGDKFINTSGIGLGQTDNAGRNAGVGTAVGTIIFNSTSNTIQVWTGGRWVNAGEAFIEATGGTISDYTESGTIYRAHIFTSSGTFSVTSAPATSTIDALLVGGGGGGGYYGGGGGGGAVIHVQSKPQSPGTYPVVVASGGVGAISLIPGSATPVTPSNQGGTTSAFGYDATGGGGAGSYNNIPASGGANGGGQGAYLGPPGYPAGVLGTAPTVPAPLSPYATIYAGNRGGTFGSSDPPWGDFPSGGGAGAGGNGGSVPRGSVGGAGGPGVTINIIPSPPSVNSGNGYIWGGGGGGSIYDPPGGTGGAGGPGGGGAGADSATGGTGGINLGSNPVGAAGGSGGQSTGGGGGGSSYSPSPGANGGSGIVVVRYQIGSLAATAKATGGLISYSGDKTIHTFLSSGTFTVTNPSLSSVDYLVVAGGGGAGGTGPTNTGSGGGGAGGFRTGTGLPVSSSPGIYNIQVGSGGAGGNATAPGANTIPGSNGVDSIFSTITSTGGGGGGTPSPPSNGASGGSGGGGSGAGTGGAGNTPPTSPAQGTNGGAGISIPTNFSGGGGGGAGGNPEVAATPTRAGNGGPGAVSTISGTSVTYAGGGGGGMYIPGGTAGAAGPGGGGAGATGSTPAPSWDPIKNGVTNLGGGGGGVGGGPVGGRPGGNGGSGIVIIAYPS